MKTKAKRGRPPKAAALIAKPIAAPSRISGETLSKLVIKGDLSGLTPQETMEYYLRFCEHLGLDPVTRPFDLLVLNDKRILYAHKGCTDQLRMKYGVSVTDLKGEMLNDCYRVTAMGRDHKGRTDAATGVVKVKGLTGDQFANAVMKAETKAKRRLTLSLCGLGMLDESEIETIPGAITVDLGGEVKSDPPVYDVGDSVDSVVQHDPNDAETWRWVKVGKAPQSYWAKKGNREAQQLALVAAFGPAVEYKVEKTDEGWMTFRKLGVPAEEGQKELDAIAEKAWTPEVEGRQPGQD